MKTSGTKLKYLKYLFWFGPVLTLIGLVSAGVSGSWSPVPLGLLIAGLVIIGLWLLFLGSSPRSFWGRRSTQVGTNALAATLSVLVILGLINYLAVRHPVRVDLTESKMFTLAPLSQEVVRNLQQPVKAWIFEVNENSADRELLENYRRYGSQFSYEFVNPELKPTLAQKFGVQSVGEVYLESGVRRQLLLTINEQERLTEPKLTNGIEQIISDRKDKIYFLQGHGERALEAGEGSLSQAVSALTDKNFISQPLNLAERSEVPKDATVVVIAGPKRSLFEAEVKALNSYLKGGGSLFVMVDPGVTAGLESLLKQWGVQLDNGLVIDPSEGALYGPGVPIVTDYGQHPITQSFGKSFSFYRLARPVVTTPIAGIKETPLLFTNPQSWAESNPESEDLQFNPESDRQGPLVLGVALNRVFPTISPETTPAATPTASPSQSPEAKATASPTASPESQATTPPTPSQSPEAKATTSPTQSPEQVEKSHKKSAESRLVVLGNSDFTTDGLFDKQLNGDVFLNSVSWLSKRDQQAFSIRPKETKNRRLNLSPQLASSIIWSALAAVPLLGLISAGIIWWQRR